MTDWRRFLKSMEDEGHVLYQWTTMISGVPTFALHDTGEVVEIPDWREWLVEGRTAPKEVHDE